MDDLIMRPVTAAEVKFAIDHLYAHHPIHPDIVEPRTITIDRVFWESALIALSDAYRAMTEMEKKLAPANTEGPNIIDLKLERIKRKNQAPERMKPL